MNKTITIIGQIKGAPGGIFYTLLIHMGCHGMTRRTKYFKSA